MYRYASFVSITIIFLFVILISSPVYSRDNTIVATVFDLEIRRGDVIESKSKSIYFLLMPKVFSEYKKTNNINVSEADIDKYIIGNRKIKEKFFEDSKRELKELYLATKNVKEYSKEWEKAVSRTIFLENIIKSEDKMKFKDIKDKKHRKNVSQYLEKWKIDKSIYKKYKGRIAIKELFHEPIDAYYKLLKEYKQKGHIEIHDSTIEDMFWSYFENSSNHIFIDDSENSENILLKPDWLGRK